MLLQDGKSTLFLENACNLVSFGEWIKSFHNLVVIHIICLAHTGIPTDVAKCILEKPVTPLEPG